MTDARPLPVPDNTFQYLSAAAVRERLDIRTVTAAIRQAFLTRAETRLENPPRQSLGDGGLLVMTARSRTEPHSVVKVLHLDRSGDLPPDVPSIRGLLIWLGPNDEPIVAADAGTVTLLRTAAIVVAATELLAEPQASTLAMLGSGRQAAEQISGIARHRELTEVTIWSRTRAHAEDLVARLSAEFPQIRMSVATDPDSAVRDADIVCCATSATRPLFAADSVAPHAHVNAIGSYLPSMRELPEELLRQATILAVDDVPACLEEAGELIDAIGTGAIAVDDLQDFGALLADPPQRSGVTVFKSVGVALADFAVADLLRQESGNGERPAWSSQEAQAGR